MHCHKIDARTRCAMTTMSQLRQAYEWVQCRRHNMRIHRRCFILVLVPYVAQIAIGVVLRCRECAAASTCAAPGGTICEMPSEQAFCFTSRTLLPSGGFAFVKNAIEGETAVEKGCVYGGAVGCRQGRCLCNERDFCNEEEQKQVPVLQNIVAPPVMMAMNKTGDRPAAALAIPIVLVMVIV